jgi:Na+/melibiose symporter-like transporter
LLSPSIRACTNSISCYVSCVHLFLSPLLILFIYICLYDTTHTQRYAESFCSFSFFSRLFFYFSFRALTKPIQDKAENNPFFVLSPSISNLSYVYRSKTNNDDDEKRPILIFCSFLNSHSLSHPRTVFVCLFIVLFLLSSYSIFVSWTR